jgi:lipopolysaccharide/colanic/teichoic acid biosynthesis glycosyltransferase
MRAKRTMDIVIAVLVVVVLSPLLLLIAVAVAMADGRPILYLGTRVGQHGRLFALLKFRTMSVAKPEPSDPSLCSEGAPSTGGVAPVRGASVTVWDDPRITGLGRVLRRLKLDELPQLFNVLRGEMSLVGPRPEDPEYVALYTEEQRRILDLKPGITSVAALRYWDEVELLKGDDWETVYREQLVPAKIALELEYAARRSLWSDLGVMARTALGLFHHIAGGN